MSSLREKLNEEVTLWKKEREEFQLLREKSDALAFEEANAAARAAAAAYAVESPLSKDLSNDDRAMIAMTICAISGCLPCILISFLDL
jgi:uncharacterized protein YciW